MTAPQQGGVEQRVLVLVPTERDAGMTQAILERAGIHCATCNDLHQLCERLQQGAAAALLPEEAAASDGHGRLRDWLQAQPPWSDLPLVVLARPGANSAAVAEAMDRLGNVTVLERPTRVAALVSAVRTALRARQRQYQIRDQIAEQLRAARELNASQSQLAAEAEALARLHELSSRLWQMSNLHQGLDEMLQATMELLDADCGQVQLLHADRDVLETVAQRGFIAGHEPEREQPLAQAAAAAALGRGTRLVIANVDNEPAYVPWREQARAAGFCALQSTPLIGRAGARLGLLTTGFSRPHRPSAQELRRLDLYSRQVADFIERCRADQALRDADRRKDEFLAMLAHELRNPLAPIRNLLHALRLGHMQLPQAEHFGEVMERQVEHMVRLVDDLLDVSRITRGKIELRRHPLAIAAVIDSAIETSRPALQAGGQELVLELADEPLLVDGDATRLTQVFANLLNNAAKYTPTGGRIRLGARRDGDCVVIAVRDSGIGIPAAMLGRVFDLFTQVERGGYRGQGGLGIGLTLVRNLVELHGGRVDAHSDGPGRGSEFVVRLPLLPTPKDAPAPATDVPLPHSLGAHRVLVVDDNRDAAESLALLLRLFGADVLVAYGGEDALALVDDYRPTVAILDIGLPGMDGYELARRLRRRTDAVAMTLIALTGWGQEQDRRRSRAAGFDHHLIKPVDVDALQALLRTGPAPAGQPQ